MKNSKKLAKEWFTKGDHDISGAILLFREGGFTDTICFLCQQAVEKYLKGYLVSQHLRPKKIHDLVKLVEQCSIVDRDFKEIEENCHFLRDFYIEARYPLGPPVVYPKQTAKEALEKTKEIIDLIKKKT